MVIIWSNFREPLFLFIFSHEVWAINFAVHREHQPDLLAAAPAAAPAGPGFKLPGIPESDDDYKVIFTVGNLNDGSTGTFTIRVHPGWAPLGAQRFKDLLDSNFFDNSKFFRIIPGFVAQFGLAADARVTSQWIRKFMKDDPLLNIPNSRGRISFSTAGKDTRAVQIFVNIADNLGLDAQGFTPFAEVIAGMDVVDKLYSEYGEGAPLGKGPGQRAIEALGNQYLDENFPDLSVIQHVMVVAPPTPWDYFCRISLTLMGVAMLAIGATALHRAGKLEEIRAKCDLQKLVTTLQRIISFDRQP